MPPLYSGTADEWSYVSNDTSTSPVKTVDFIIDNFETEMKKGAHILKSRPFTVKNSLWHIEVHPARKDEKSGESSVGVFLVNDNEVDMYAGCKFVVDKRVEEFVNKKVSTNHSWGFPKFLTQDACKKVLRDGKLKVTIEMKLFQEEETVISGGEKSHPTPETSILDSKIFDMMSFPDFNVICNGKEFPCHKAFLVARSSVFKNMLEANMKEANEGYVEIKNHIEIVVDSFVRFFYTSHVKDEVLKNHAVHFFDLGEQYQVEGLKKVAEQAMIANLSTENMLRFFTAGDMYQGGEIKEAAKAFIRKNRRSLVEQEGWRDAVTDKELLLDLIEALSKD